MKIICNLHESLGIYIYAKPKNQRERDYNDRMREKAEAEDIGDASRPGTFYYESNGLRPLILFSLDSND